MKYRYVIHDEDTASFTSDTEYENVDLAWLAGEAEARSLLRGWGAEWWVVDEQGNEVELDHDPYDPDGGDARDIQHEQQRWRDFNELGYIRPEHMSEAEWERERRGDAMSEPTPHDPITGITTISIDEVSALRSLADKVNELTFEWAEGYELDDDDMAALLELVCAVDAAPKLPKRKLISVDIPLITEGSDW